MYKFGPNEEGILICFNSLRDLTKQIVFELEKIVAQYGK